MSLIVFPNPNSINSYSCLISNNSDLQEIKDNLNSNKRIDKIFYISSLNESIKEEIKSSYVNMMKYEVNESEVNELLQVKIPSWIIENNIFEIILEERYMDLFPRTVEFVTTLNCNFRCRQCSYATSKKLFNVWLNGGKEGNGLPRFQQRFDSEVHMTKEVLRILIPKIATSGVKNFLLTGGGEPFKNKDVSIEAISLARDFKLNVGIYTNGSLLNEEIIEKVLSKEPLFIRISVYGGNESSFAKYTRNNGKIFHQVLTNIRILALAKKKMKVDTILGISYLMHPYTINEIGDFADKIIRSFSSEEMDQIDFIRFTPAVDYFTNKQHSFEEMRKAFMNIEEEIKPKFIGTGISIRPYYHRFEDLYKKKTYNKCLASGWYLEVGPSGSVYLCCEKFFIKPYLIGNLVIQSLDDIYNSKKRQSLINKINHNHLSDCPPLCKPHEMNKMFNSITALNKIGKSEEVKSWREDLLILQQSEGFRPGKLNDFES